MTRSSNHPDADYTPNDMGAPQKTNPKELWEQFVDQEVERLLMMEEDQPL